MKIYNKELSENSVSELLGVIKNKPLTYIDDSFLLKQVKSYLEQNVQCVDFINNLNFKNKKIKELIKTVRAKARKVYGLFVDENIVKRDSLLDEFQTSKDLSVIKEILMLHLSTKERVSYMEELYQKIFSYTKKPKSILDVGCGLNPLTYPFMDITAKYYANEFSQKDVDFINRFFSVYNIDGKADKIDLITEYEKLKSYDVTVCFLFKVLDSLERVKKYISYKILENINAEFIIVSFPLKTVTGKAMRLNERNWFEKVCTRLNKKYETFSFKNEIFYVLS